MKWAGHPRGTADCALYRNAGPMGARLPAATPAIVVVTEAIVVIPAVIAVITVSMIAIPARSGRGTGEAARVVVVEHLAVVWRLHLIGFDDTLVHQAAIFLRRDGYRPPATKKAAAAMAIVCCFSDIEYPPGFIS